jgi:hypothetical protein
MTGGTLCRSDVRNVVSRFVLCRKEVGAAVTLRTVASARVRAICHVKSPCGRFWSGMKAGVLRAIGLRGRRNRVGVHTHPDVVRFVAT